jgi:FkbM family methyltransferase
MPKLMSIPKAIAHSVLTKVPQGVLRKIEEKAQFFQGKGWGAATTDFEVAAIAVLLQRKCDSGLIALDVGANVGNWTHSFNELFPDSSVIAFEPGGGAYKILDTRFQSKVNIRCINLGLSDENAEVILYSDNPESALSSLHHRNLQHFNISLDKQEKVKVVRLDSWFESQNQSIIPTILKLDVEGHELSVLAGAKEVLNRIELVQFEFGGGNIDSKTYFQDFWYFFKNLNFDIYRLTPRGPIKVSEYSEFLEVFRPTNYFAVRK